MLLFRPIQTHPLLPRRSKQEDGDSAVARMLLMEETHRGAVALAAPVVEALVEGAKLPKLLTELLPDPTTLSPPIRDFRT